MAGLLLLAGCGSGGSESEGTQEYVVGATLELSGASSVWGIPQRDSLKLLERQINSRGGIGGVPLRLIIYDNESDGTKALTTVKKLVEEDKVLAIVGGGSTPTTMPLIPYVTEAQVPLVSVGASNAIVEPAAERQWVFKTPNDDRDQAAAILDFLRSKGVRRIALLTVNTAYGDSGKVEFETLAPVMGFEIGAAEKFGATDKDVKAQLTTIKAKQPEATIVWAIPPAASIATRNFTELGVPGILIHGAGVGSVAFVDLAGGPEMVEGTYVASSKLWFAEDLPDDDPQKELLLEYTREYEAETGATVSNIGAMAYDALWLIVNALERSGPARQKLRDEIERTAGLVGLLGTYNLSPEDHQGLNKDDVHIVQARNGVFVQAD